MLILSPGTVLAQDEKTELTLRLMPGDYNRSVTPGEDNTLYLEVHNTGNKSITNIEFSSDGPEGWDIDFEPASIGYLGNGSQQTVNVSIRPAANTYKGRYQFNLIAEANETRRVTSIYLRVETFMSTWLWMGIAVAALVIGGFVIIYLRFGRQ